MLDTLTSTNHQDFRQRYDKTFGWFNTGERKLLVYVEEVNDREVVFSDKQGTKYNVFRDSGLNFEFIPVDRGWFNTNGGAYYITRVPARQWHRGICKSNTQMHFRANGRFHVNSVSITALSNIFEYAITPKKVLERYMASNIQGALSKHFALSEKQFMFYDQVVGEISIKDSKLVVDLTEKIVHQEVSDLINRNKFDIELRG